MRVAKVGTLLVMIGMAGTLVFGIWLAISLDAYKLWDGWVIAALILWAIGGFLGQKAGEGYQAGGELGEKLAADGVTSSPELAETFGASRAFWFHNATLVVVLRHSRRDDLEAGRMTGVIAAIRPDDWNFPLLVHVLGAMILVGAVLTAVVAQLSADATAVPDRMRSVAFRTLLFVGIPSWFAMAIGAQWIYDKEFGDVEEDPAWIGIGFITRELGGLLLLIATICAGIASRKNKSGLAKASAILAAIALIGWVVAIWAMGAKPD